MVARALQVKAIQKKGYDEPLVNKINYWSTNNNRENSHIYKANL
jgi:hypothetical protein